MMNGNHLFQHAAFPPPSEVILNQWSKSQPMPICFGYGKPNRRPCSMRAEALPGVGGWQSVVSPGELAHRLKALEKLRWTMSVSLPRVKAMLSWITDSRRWLCTLCAVCVEKKPSSIWFFIFSPLQLHYHFAVIYVILHTSSFVETTSSFNANNHFNIKDPSF